MELEDTTVTVTVSPLIFRCNERHPLDNESGLPDPQAGGFDPLLDGSDVLCHADSVPGDEES